MITVVNRRLHKGEGVYIGRPKLPGNSFRIGRDGTREEAGAKYREWLWRQIRRRGDVYREPLRLAEIASNEDLYLICWRKRPEQNVSCHGDILKAAVTWINSTTEA